MFVIRRLHGTNRRSVKINGKPTRPREQTAIRF
jgi:hypothetical protein